LGIFKDLRNCALRDRAATWGLRVLYVGQSGAGQVQRINTT
jgi:hypothetical protein